MAIYHLHVTSISRGHGKSAVAKAAYNARDKLRDERDGELKDYSRHGDETVFSGIFAPKDAPEWAHDREQLWNAVEQRETHKKAQLAVEITGALPHEFTDQQREWLAKDFIREEFTRKGLVVDLHIHYPPREPEREGDKPNHHFHALIPLREIGPDGFGERVLNSGSLKENTEYVKELREQWEHLVNRHLERHGFEERIDRRTLEAQGIEREPGKHRGPVADAMERRGIETDRGNLNHEAEAGRAAAEITGERKAQPAPLFDRDAAEREWMEKLTDAAIAYNQVRDDMARAKEVATDPAYMDYSIEQLRELRTGFRETRRDVAEQLQRDALLPSEREALQATDGAAREGLIQVRRALHEKYLEEPSRFAPEAKEISRESAAVGMADTFRDTASTAIDIAGNVAEKVAEGIGFLADSFGGGHSAPTPEVKAARQEAAEQREQAAIDWKRWASDDGYRKQVNEQEQIKREQEAQEYMRKQERELHPNERERER
jgi:MobA/MobL family